MRILGIDPGSLKAGYAVVEVVGKKINLIGSGVISFGKDQDFFSRLIELNFRMKEVVREFRPDECALESLIYVKNVSSLAKLSQARGAMISALEGLSSTQIFEYSPNLIKSMVSGHGHSSKESIEKMVQLLIGEKLNFKSSDESDALAIAICHSLMRDERGTKNILRSSQSKARSMKDHFKHLEK